VSRARERTAAPENDPQLEQRFRTLAAEWDEETGHLSSITQMARHPAYQQIIGMGPAVVPLLLRDLERTHTPLVLGAHRDHRRESRFAERPGKRPADGGGVGGVGAITRVDLMPHAR
jgi:hypothetical protein